MLAIAQVFGRNGETLVLYRLGRPAIVRHVDVGDISLAAGAHGHILRPAQHGIDHDAAKRDSRRQRGDFKFDSLNRLRPAFIDRAEGDGIAAGREFRGVDGEVQPIAADGDPHLRISAEAGYRRLALGGDRAA